MSWWGFTTTSYFLELACCFCEDLPWLSRIPAHIPWYICREMWTLIFCLTRSYPNLWVIPYTGIVDLHLLPVNLRNNIKPNLCIPGEFHPTGKIKEVWATAWDGEDIGEVEVREMEDFLLAVLCVMFPLVDLFDCFQAWMGYYN